MKKFNFLIVCVLLLPLVISFRAAKKDVSIIWKPVFGERPLTIGDEQYISPSGDTLYVDLMRFYISSVKIHFEDGSVYSEKNSFHLIEISNESNPQITLKNVPDRVMKRLSFSIGVDSLACVSGALEGDLDPARGMYWAWNSCYINAKLEGRSNSCHTHQHTYEFHIGGYLHPHQSIRHVSLDLHGETDTILMAADAKAWFNGVELSKTHSIVIPGTEAVKMADNYTKMFYIQPLP